MRLTISIATSAFLVSSLGCASSNPETPAPVQAAAETPQEPSIVATEIVYEAEGTPLLGYLAMPSKIPEGEGVPGVLVAHEWWGHNDYARARANILAEMGYAAFALDMYGEGKQAEHPEDAMAFMNTLFSTEGAAKGRFEAALNLLKARDGVDGSKMAAIGYCMGGGVVLSMARAGVDLKGIASFHGSLGTKSPAAKGAVKAKLLVLNGGADPMVPPEQVEAFRKEMKNAGAKLEMHTYPEAQHAFTNPAATANGEKFELPLKYDEAADKDSWARLEKFLAAVFR